MATSESRSGLNEEPLVSIVLPVHNRSRFLASAVHGCLSQSYSNWELILVDDGSSDDTPDEIERLVSLDGRIRSVAHETNLGLPSALNTGFSYARGRYFTWTSDDNIYQPQALEVMVKALQTSPHVDVVYADYTMIDDAGNALGKFRCGPAEELGIRNSVGGCFLYRREVQEKLGGYREDLFLIEDLDFWIRASAFFELMPIPDDLYLFRFHPTSLTSTRAEDVQSALEVALLRNVEIGMLRKPVLASCLLGLAHLAHKKGDLAAARRYIIQAARNSGSVCLRYVHFHVFVEAFFGSYFTDLLRICYRFLRRLTTTRQEDS